MCVLYEYNSVTTLRLSKTIYTLSTTYFTAYFIKSYSFYYAESEIDQKDVCEFACVRWDMCVKSVCMSE